MKRMKGLFLAFAVVVSLGLFVGCKNESNTVEPYAESLQDVEIWGAPATEKILQDAHNYDSIKTKAEINLTMVKGEYESYQIIMTPKKNVKSYTISMSDIVLEGGEYKFDNENISVYNEKYIYVGTIYDGLTNAKSGMYPDAILPMDTAVTYGENTIKAGNNQGVYVTFETAQDCVAGIYKGAMTINFDKFSQVVPIQIEVLDFALDEEVHTKSIFSVTWPFGSGELNHSQNMLDAYVEKLFEYRLAPSQIVTDTNLSEESATYYADKAYEFMQNPRCSNISLPTSSKVDAEGETVIDANITERYLRAYVKKSNDTNYNMFAKSVYYIGIIDEPQVFNMIARVRKVVTSLRGSIEKIACEYENDTTLVCEKKAEIIQSLRNLKNVVTAHYDETYAPYVSTWCPTVDYYNTEASRNDYKNQEEKWWYTCIQPRAPYPTFHTEDTLISARALGWMQAEYNVTGNLFWATNIYAESDGSIYTHLEDYYDNVTRYPRCNGDGYLFYPGGQYGLSEPVATLRLEAIRDGLEEYEIITAIKNKYQVIAERENIEVFAEKSIAPISSLLYAGTQVKSDSSKFASARNSLLDLLTSVSSTGEMVVMDYNDDGLGNVTYKVYLNDKAILTCNGEEVKKFAKTENGKVYTVTVKLDDVENYASFAYEIDGKSYGVTNYLGGKATVYTPSEFISSIKEDLVKPVVTLEENKIKAEIPVGENGLSQSIAVTGDIVQGLNESTSKIVFTITNTEEYDIIVSLSAMFSNGDITALESDVKISAGETIQLSVALNTVAWERYGKIESLLLAFGTDYPEEYKKYLPYVNIPEKLKEELAKDGIVDETLISEIVNVLSRERYVDEEHKSVYFGEFSVYTK